MQRIKMKSLPRTTIVIDTLKTSPVFKSLAPVPIPNPFPDSMVFTRPELTDTGYVVD